MSQDEISRSQPHRRIERILSKMQISYKSEEEFRPYSVDIYLPEWHLGIEVDGPAHSAKKDAVRDEVLEEKYFLPILRLKTALNLSPDKITEAIEDFIIKWAPSTEQRKSQWIAVT